MLQMIDQCTIPFVAQECVLRGQPETIGPAFDKTASCILAGGTSNAKSPVGQLPPFAWTSFWREIL